MTYTLDESHDSRNYTPGADCEAVFGLPRTIDFFTGHWWGNKGQDFGTVRDFLCTNTTPTSAHFVVEAGQVACIVAPEDVAWHSGNGRGNATSVGIELHPEATDEDYQTAAELLAWLRATYGDKPLVPHNYWYNTACPGEWDLARLDALSRTITDPHAAPPITQTAPTVAPATTFEATVEAGDTLSSVAGQFGRTVAEILAINNIADPNHIVPGQVLEIPGPWNGSTTARAAAPAAGGPSQCVVEDNDTLSGIGEQFGVDWQQIAALNGIGAPYTLYPGQVLALPAGGAPAPAPAPVPAPAAGPSQCVVEDGDTLSGIGEQFGVDWQQIAALNGIGAPYVIEPGQVLNLR